MAYNSTSWTTDSLTKATNSTSTDDSLNISGTLTVAGASQLNSTLTIGVDDTGYDVKFFGATSGKYMLWDESEDVLQFTDSAGVTFGTGSDLTIYHNGSHSYISNTTGTLYIGASTSGVPVSIGHTTSETTVNDNLTVTGNFDITNDSGVEINLNGSSAANIYSEGNLFIKAESGRTLNLGANGQLDSITIDTSENVTLTGGYLVEARTVIKIKATDFYSNDDVTSVAYGTIEDDGSNYGIRGSVAGTNTFYAYIDVPLGYTATKVRILGSDTGNAVEVYTLDLDDGTISSEISNSGLNVGDDTALDSNHVGADDKILLIKAITSANDDIIYGGYVTITAT
tara:strand:- start:257 stop:1279 length:1023 start_codon:yes stop_codon:yes gene_type:complete